MKKDTVKFTKKEVKSYIDAYIKIWRDKKTELIDEQEEIPGVYNTGKIRMCTHYIDAYQCIRNSLFGELLS